MRVKPLIPAWQRFGLRRIVPAFAIASVLRGCFDSRQRMTFGLWFDWLLALGLFAGLVGSLELWFLLGTRARRRKEEPPDQLSNLQGAMLGLLALLLGFSFALAAGRFSDRVQLISQEANAIGTVWLRCDLLADPARREAQSLLREYTRLRVASYEVQGERAWRENVTASGALHTPLWRLVLDATRAQKELGEVLLPPFNEMFDLHGTRVAAARRHLPGMLLALLLASSAVAVGAVGYGCGVAGQRNVVLTTALCFLVAGVLWAIIDLDHPVRGVIRAGQQPMLDLQKSLNASP